MVIEKQMQKKKLLKQFDDEEKKKWCSVCRQVLSKADIESCNFEYVKNKYGENYAHSSCINKEKK